jgi:hypothetical protein
VKRAKTVQANESKEVSLHSKWHLLVITVSRCADSDVLTDMDIEDSAKLAKNVGADESDDVHSRSK